MDVQQLAPTLTVAAVTLSDGTQASLLPGAAAPGAPPLWTSAHLQLAHGGVHLVSFDPSTRSFKDTYVP